MSIETDFRKEQIDRLRPFLSNKLLTTIIKGGNTPCFLLNKSAVNGQYNRLRTAMPAIEPHFAVKSCPMPELLAVFKDMSAHLDVATEGELAILAELNYPPELLIYTHPHKTPRAMKKAFDYGIRTFVLDDLSEAEILKPYKQEIQVLARLSFSNNNAAIDLSYKFGLDISVATQTIGTLLQDGFTIVGCSFHVGSQMNSAEPYAFALTQTANVYREVQKKFKHTLTMLDIGGGFPTPYTEPVMEIEEFAKTINPLVESLFSGVRVISEPGRYLVNPSVTLLSQVTSITMRAGRPWVFMDDGVYGSFSDMLSGHSTYLLLNASELTSDQPLTSHIVAGPTCDSIDVVDADALLPPTAIGDIIVTPNMGAYSYALSSQFNSIPKAGVIVI